MKLLSIVIRPFPLEWAGGESGGGGAADMEFRESGRTGPLFLYTSAKSMSALLQRCGLWYTKHMREPKYAEIIVDIAHSNVDKIFDYALPEGMEVLPGCRVEVHTVEDAVRPIQRYDRDPAIRCIVLFSSPLVAQELRRHGVEMGSLCIGGMQRRPERKAFYKNQNATGEEMAAMAGMVADGVKIYHKIVPSEAQVDLTNYIR